MEGEPAVQFDWVFMGHSESVWKETENEMCGRTRSNSAGSPCVKETRNECRTALSNGNVGSCPGLHNSRGQRPASIGTMCLKLTQAFYEWLKYMCEEVLVCVVVMMFFWV
jgi:hypothetical protein